MAEPTTLEAIQIAVGHGMRMLEDCYEEVTLKLDDDTDDDDDLVQHR